MLVYNLCTVLKLFHGRDIMCKESCKKRYLLIVICPCNHNPSPLTLARRIAADSCPPAAANPSPVDPVHTSRPGVLLIPPNFSPGGLLIPPNFPREFFLGGRKGSGCRGRAEGTEATATSTTCHGLRGLEGPPEHPPPSPVELLRRGTRLPGGGSYVRVLLCVSCVHASCVHIWFVSCPRQMWLSVNSCPAVFV